MKKTQTSQVTIPIEKDSQLDIFYRKEKDQYRNGSLSKHFQEILIARMNILQRNGQPIDSIYWPQPSQEEDFTQRLIAGLGGEDKEA